MRAYFPSPGKRVQHAAENASMEANNAFLPVILEGEARRFLMPGKPAPYYRTGEAAIRAGFGHHPYEIGKQSLLRAARVVIAHMSRCLEIVLKLRVKRRAGQEEAALEIVIAQQGAQLLTARDQLLLQRWLTGGKQFGATNSLRTPVVKSSSKRLREEISRFLQKSLHFLPVRAHHRPAQIQTSVLKRSV